MTLFDAMGLRAQRSASGALHLYAKVRRGLSSLTTTKIVIVPSKTSKNGRVQLATGVSSTPTPAPVPASRPAATPPAPPPAAAVPPPAPIPAPPPAAVPQPVAVAGTAIRRASAAISPAQPQESKIIIGTERNATGARLQEARRLNRIAVIGVVVGIFNLVGLIVAIAFAGSMLHALTNSTTASAGTMKIDQRAWVGLASSRLAQPYSRSRIGVTLVLENTGKTPAAIDAVDVSIRAVTAGTNRRFALSSTGGGTYSIAPGAREPLQFFEARPLSEAGFAALANRRVRHDFAITVRYRDVFGDTHRTQICKSVGGSAAAMAGEDSLPSCSPGTMD